LTTHSLDKQTTIEIKQQMGVICQNVTENILPSFIYARFKPGDTMEFPPENMSSEEMAFNISHRLRDEWSKGEKSILGGK
jgi:hypothetical protein